MESHELAIHHRSHVWTLWANSLILKRCQQLGLFRTIEQQHGSIPYVVPVIFGLLFFVVVSFLTLISDMIGGISTYSEVFVALVTLTFVVSTNFIGAERINRRVISLLLNDLKIENKTFWCQISSDIKGQWQVGGLIAILIGILILPRLIPQVYNSPTPGIVFYGAITFTLFLWFTSAYAATLASLNMAVHIPELEVEKLYKFNPQDTPIIGKISRLFSIAFVTQSVASCIVILGIVISHPSSVTFAAAAFASAIAFAILVAGFLFARHQIGEFITKAKYEVLKEINEKINEIYKSEAPSKEKREELENWFKLYDSVNKRIRLGVGFDVLSGYFSSLLWPIVTFFIVNFTATQDMLIGISAFVDSFFV